MKAIIYEKYGSPEVLRIVDMEKPVPKDNEVLIKTVATTAHIGDTRMRALVIPGSFIERFIGRLYLGWSGPRRKILGMEMSGVVEEIGKNVTKYEVGDELIVNLFPGLTFGGYAEYKVLKENWLMTKKPETISFEEAAALPAGGATALDIVRKVDIQKGQSVLVYGASGSVGTYVVQLVKILGGNVTGVCSTSNLEMVKSLGADKVADYTTGDLEQTLGTYDVVIDAVGKLKPELKKRTIKPGGKFFNVNKVGGKLKDEDLVYLTDLAKEGKLKVVIDKTYPYTEIVEAHRYVEKGHKKGNVAISFVS